MSSLEEMVAPFLTVRQVIVLPISTLSTMFLAYGFYSLLFCATVRKLKRKPDTSNHRLYLGFIVALFTFASMEVVVEAWSQTRQSIINFTAARTRNYLPLAEYNSCDTLKLAHFTILNILPVLLNYTAEMMMVRLHCVLTMAGSSKDHTSRSDSSMPRYLGLPNAGRSASHHYVGPHEYLTDLLEIGLSGALMGSVGGSDMQKDSNRRIFELGGSIRAAYDLAGLTFNILLTILTAGRIWHVGRAACETMGQDVRRWYATIITIM
ncbi:hypothetical protein PM082_022021 [Marasmius tenuissimus]|nr:hypothetical protein PM082_022021 [Marasmius tenuissimus]